MGAGPGCEGPRFPPQVSRRTGVASGCEVAGPPPGRITAPRFPPRSDPRLTHRRDQEQVAALRAKRDPPSVPSRSCGSKGTDNRKRRAASDAITSAPRYGPAPSPQKPITGPRGAEGRGRQLFLCPGLQGFLAQVSDPAALATLALGGAERLDPWSFGTSASRSSAPQSHLCNFGVVVFAPLIRRCALMRH